MKKQIDVQLIAIFTGGLIFNFLFWNEGLSINLLIYSLFIITMFVVNKKIIKSKKLYFYGAFHLIATLLVIFNHSDLNIVSYYITLVVFVGYAQAQLIRSVFTIFLSGFLQILAAPINLISSLVSVKIGTFSIHPFLKYIKYIFIPVFALMIFSLIYSSANQVFASYLDLLLNGINNLITSIYTFIFGDLSLIRFLHIILGILFTAGLLLTFKKNGLEIAELTSTENLIRKRRIKNLTNVNYELKEVFYGNWMKRKMALKTENIIGIISFSTLNLLLLFLNSIDIQTLWFNKLDNLPNQTYATQLHEGTNALIFSIVLAMLVILYFFSGNINFFSKNKAIRVLAYIWIIQNTFLILSVGLRDFNYIITLGLTYKRIGVLVFLILCTVGLITVYVKVARRKSFFYLFKTNSLIWYILLIVFGFVNWDVLIVSYNLNHRKSILLDIDHLTSMSDKTLPLLHKNRLLLKPFLPQSNFYQSELINHSASFIVKKNTTDTIKTDIDSVKLAIEFKQQTIVAFDNHLDERIKKFKKEQKNYSWLSWNYRDWETSLNLENVKL